MERDIIIVSEMFYPDKTSTAYIMTKIADELSKTANIVVLTTDNNYDGTKFSIGSEDKSYKIVRIRGGVHDKNKLLSRTYRMVSTSLKLFFKLWSIVTPNCDVIIVTNPAPFLILASILKRIKGFKLSIIVQDVFPENANAAGLISSKNVVYKIAKNIWEHSYHLADRLIVCGRDMKEIFRSKLSRFNQRPEIIVIENWADKNLLEYENLHINDDPIEILFAGNIGRCQGIESFLDIIKNNDISNVNIRFRGDGAVVPNIKNFIGSNPGKKVFYGGRYSRDEQFSILSNCDIALVTLTDGMFGLGVPSKSYNIMSAGKPILYIGDPNSEIALIIKEHNIGYSFAPSEQERIVNWLKNLNQQDKKDFIQKGKIARELAKTLFSEDTILKKYTDLFSK